MAAGLGATARGLDDGGLVAEVRRALDDALDPGVAVGVAVSGGPDSTALALLVARARPDLRPHVLHVRHGLRDDRPDADAAEAVARRLALPFAVASVQVGRGGGPEAAARTARLAALRRLAEAHGLVAVLLGHTAEDQAETVLLNLARGTGVTGLGGMRPERDVAGLRLVRPLLRLRRADVRAAGERAGLVVVHDPTNDDGAQRRARARHALLPALAGLAGGPGDPVGVLTRLADLAAEDAALLDAEAERAAAAIATAHGPVQLLRAAGLAALPPPLARRAVRAAVVRAGAGTPSAADVEAVLALPPQRVATLAGGVRASRSAGWVALRPDRIGPLPERPLPAGPGAVALAEVDALLLVAEPGHAAGAAHGTGDRPAWAPGPGILHLAHPPAGWVVGGPRPGERMLVAGRGRALRELLRARAVPRPVRDLLPVLRAADGSVAWVPGVAVADAWASPPAAGSSWSLQLRPAGDPGGLG